MLLFLCSVVLALLTYIYYRDVYRRWHNVGIKHVGLWSSLRQWKDLLLGRKLLYQVLDEVYHYDQNEVLMGFYGIYEHVILIKDPQLIRWVLEQNYGQFGDKSIGKVDRKLDPVLGNELSNLSGCRWKYVRSSMLKAFTTGKLNQMESRIYEYVTEFEDELRNAAQISPINNINSLIGKLVITVLNQCVIGIDLSEVEEEHAEYKLHANALLTVTKSTENQIKTLVNSKVREILNVKILPELMSYSYMSLFTNLIHEQANHQSNNLLDILLNAQRMESIQLKNDSDELLNQRVFTDEVIAAQLLSIQLNGYESMTLTLSKCLHELAKNKEIQEKLRKELASSADIKSSTYLENTILEAIRMHSPKNLIHRICTSSCQIPGTNIRLEKGDKLVIPSYSIHYDQKYYSNPKIFQPERHTAENRSKLSSCCFLGFGTGPRYCPASRFVMLVLKICVASIIQKFKFSLPENSEEKSDVLLLVEPSTVNM